MTTPNVVGQKVVRSSLLTPKTSTVTPKRTLFNTSTFSQRALFQQHQNNNNDNKNNGRFFSPHRSSCNLKKSWSSGKPLNHRRSGRGRRNKRRVKSVDRMSLSGVVDEDDALVWSMDMATPPERSDTCVFFNTTTTTKHVAALNFDLLHTDAVSVNNSSLDNSAGAELCPMSSLWDDSRDKFTPLFARHNASSSFLSPAANLMGLRGSSFTSPSPSSATPQSTTIHDSTTNKNDSNDTSGYVSLEASGSDDPSTHVSPHILNSSGLKHAGKKRRKISNEDGDLFMSPTLFNDGQKTKENIPPVQSTPILQKLRKRSLTTTRR